MKFKSLDKQLEEKAMRWYKKECYYRDVEQDERIDKNKVVKAYLRARPDVKQEYIEKARTINKIKMAAGLGLLTIAVGTGIAYHSSDKTKESNDNSINITSQLEDTELEIEENEGKEYTEFFEEIRDMENTQKRNSKILEFTKGKMVDAYNNQNPDNTITTERLKIYHLDEYVLVNKDKFGNTISYERVSQTKDVYNENGHILSKISGGLYVYQIDDKTVAVYDQNGQEIVDNSIENKETFFKNTIALVNETENLEDIYKYNNNDIYIQRQEEKYKEAIQNFENKFSKDKTENIIDIENEK